MPAWLLSAFSLIRTAFVGGPVRALATGAVGGQLVGSGLGDVSLPLLGGEEKKKRRRRRRALTASDRADIGFITGLLGQPAGKSFAITLASRHY